MEEILEKMLTLQERGFVFDFLQPNSGVKADTPGVIQIPFAANRGEVMDILDTYLDFDKHFVSSLKAIWEKERNRPKTGPMDSKRSYGAKAKGLEGTIKDGIHGPTGILISIDDRIAPHWFAEPLHGQILAVMSQLDFLGYSVDIHKR